MASDLSPKHENNIFDLWGCFVTLILFFILSIVPLKFGIFNDARPMFLVAAIYYWALFRPAFLGILGIFIIGFLYDLILGLSLGLTSILLIGVYMITERQRVVLLRQPFTILWGGFSLLTACASLFKWTLSSLISFDFLHPGFFMLEFALTVVSFPVIVLILKAGNTSIHSYLESK